MKGMNHPEPPPDTVDLAALIAMLTLSDREVAQALGVSPITVRSWRTGRRSPSAENRESLVASARAHAQGILRLALDLERRGTEGAASPSPGTEGADDGTRSTGTLAQGGSASPFS
jgi:transcriptional regulator with XRE-family HTH domain